jgi:hypothetical protein
LCGGNGAAIGIADDAFKRRVIEIVKVVTRNNSGEKQERAKAMQQVTKHDSPRLLKSAVTVGCCCWLS